MSEEEICVETNAALRILMRPSEINYQTKGGVLLFNFVLFLRFLTFPNPKMPLLCAVLTAYLVLPLLASLWEKNPAGCVLIVSRKEALVHILNKIKCCPVQSIFSYRGVASHAL